MTLGILTCEDDSSNEVLYLWGLPKLVKVNTGERERETERQREREEREREERDRETERERGEGVRIIRMAPILT